MPYDEELARIRAQMLANQDDEPPVFDDGARYLGQDPNMMPVALFGRPKKPVAPPTAPPINLQRRSILGLPQVPADLPAVVPPTTPKPTPQQIEQAVPQQQPSSSAPSTSPLQSLADKALNAPMTRRDVLQRAGQAALQQVVPMPKVTDIVPEIAPKTMSPLAEAASDVFVPNPEVDKYLEDYVSNILSDVSASEPSAGILSAYSAMRQYLEGRIPAKELSKLDKLNSRVERYYDNDDEYSDRAIDAQSSLSDAIHERLKLLKPHELMDVNDYLNESILTPEEMYEYVTEDRYTGDLSSVMTAEDFAKYIEKSMQSSKSKLKGE